MNQVATISKNEVFHRWCTSKGYLSNAGELTVPLRSAMALFFSEDIQKHKDSIEESFVAIAKSLWVVYREAYWTELGYDNFTMFLGSPEIDISKSVGYSLCKLGQLLEQGVVEEQRALDIGTSKMRTLLPVIAEEKNEEVRQEWFNKAEMLTNLDLMDAVSGKEIQRYQGSGKLDDLLAELRESGHEVFWQGDVHLRIRTL